MIKMFTGLHDKYPLSCPTFIKLEFSRHILNFIKIFPVGAELFHADGQTDRHDEAIRYISQFCERV
jgi:hypothetical protein